MSAKLQAGDGLKDKATGLVWVIDRIAKDGAMTLVRHPKRVAVVHRRDVELYYEILIPHQVAN